MKNNWFFWFKQFFKAKAFWLIFFGLCVFVVVQLLDAANLVAKGLGYDGFFGGQLFSVFDFVAPFLFLVFLYSWVWIPCLGFVNSKFGWFTQKRDHSSLFGPLVLDKKLLGFLLVACLVFTGFLAFFPVLNSPGTILVGSDSFHYYEILSRMLDEGPLFVFGSDRPLTYLLLFFVSFVSGFSAVATVQVLPVFVACTLFLAVFWFTRVGTRNDGVSLICGIFTLFSFQLTVSVYGYFLGNWIAIFLVFVIFVFSLRALKTQSFIFLAFSCLVSFAVFLVHPYTWYILLGSLSLFLVWNFFKSLGNWNKQKKFEIYFLSIFLVVNGLLFVLYSILPFGESLVGSANFLVTNVSGVFDFSNILFFTGTITDAVVNWVRGHYLHPILLLFAIFGFYWVSNFKSQFSRFLIFWIAPISLLLFVVGSGNSFAHRLLYLVPFQIFGGLGFYQLLSVIDNQELFSNSKKIILKWSLILGVILSFLNYVFVSLDSLPFFVL